MPNLYLHTHKAMQKVCRDSLEIQILLRHHDGDLLLRGASTAVRTNNRDGMLPGLQWLGEMPELALGRDIGHRLAVDDERGSRLSTADDFGHAAVKLSAFDF